MALKTDYKDDALDTSVNTQRKYQVTENSDGTKTLTDKTTYLQVGDKFGAAEVNEICKAINTLIAQLNGWTIAVVDSLPTESDQVAGTLYLSKE